MRFITSLATAVAVSALSFVSARSALGQPANTEPPVGQPVATSVVDVATWSVPKLEEAVVVVVVDMSASMSDPLDTGGPTKIDAVRTGIGDVSRLIQAETVSGGSVQLVVVVAGASKVEEFVVPDPRAALALVLVPAGRTNLLGGLDAGIRRVADLRGRRLVLATDGANGVSLDEDLKELVGQADEADIDIDVIAIGSVIGDDENTLGGLADERPAHVATAMELRAALLRGAHRSFGMLLAATGRPIQTFEVPTGRVALRISVLDSATNTPPIVTDPSRRMIADGGPARISSDAGSTAIAIAEPEPGRWAVQAGPDAVVVVSTDRRVGDENDSSGGAVSWLLVLVAALAVAALVGGVVAILWARRPPSSSRRLPPALVLTVLDGSEIGSTLVAESGEVIGRGPGADHILSDDTISRQHARVVQVDGAWAILDLQSTSGTYRNDEAVLQATVEPGDVVSLGAVQLRVEGARNA